MLPSLGKSKGTEKPKNDYDVGLKAKMFGLVMGKQSVSL